MTRKRPSPRRGRGVSVTAALLVGLAAALAARVLAASAAPASARPLVLLVGDSTTQGVCDGCPPPPAPSPAGALEMLRDRLPAESRWRDLRATSVGVGGTTSGDWVAVRPEVCAFAAKGDGRSADLGLRVLERACGDRIGLARAARAVVGETPALVLVVLGANDVMNGVAPDEYVRNLRAIADELAPSPVLIATPFWSPQPERKGLAAFADAARAAGLVTGPDFYDVHLPVDRSRVHLTAGGYAAAAALWLDKLPP
ncbi:MAG TPA: GDSL-type esterase/lipase family protein [Candidatus Binatia bacterium]|nr:GDSL-type esterase/lipase family protein [Candidatus Binatia bacterium]